MKTAALALALLVVGWISARAQMVEHGHFDEGTRFIFYSVLEGCYDDGLTNAEVDQILLKKDHQCYYHFIYACPICTPTIWALQAYRQRPDAFYSIKGGRGATFGPGLSPAQHAQLFSDDPRVRLGLINGLVKDWIARRMLAMRLNDSERAKLLADLEDKRDQGMQDLKSFKKDPGPNGVSYFAPAYLDLDECAVCNGAVGKLMKLPEGK